MKLRRSEHTTTTTNTHNETTKQHSNTAKS